MATSVVLSTNAYENTNEKIIDASVLTTLHLSTKMGSVFISATNDSNYDNGIKWFYLVNITTTGYFGSLVT